MHFYPLHEMNDINTKLLTNVQSSRDRYCSPQIRPTAVIDHPVPSSGASSRPRLAVWSLATRTCKGCRDHHLLLVLARLFSSLVNWCLSQPGCALPSCSR